MKKEVFLTPHEAAELLHVTVQSIRRYCDEGKIPCIITPGGHRRIKKSDLDTFIGSGVATPETEKN